MIAGTEGLMTREMERIWVDDMTKGVEIVYNEAPRRMKPTDLGKACRAYGVAMSIDYCSSPD